MRSILRFDFAVRLLCLLALAGYSQISSAQLITGLTVSNSTAVGGTGKAYEVCPGGPDCGTTTTGMVTNAPQYLDRSFTITSAVPSAVNGATFIMTANDDKNANPGTSSYMTFTVTQAATVYVAHCTCLTTKPAWLTSNFTDTGTSIANSSSFTFELYSASYASGSAVTLGSNVVTGGNTSQGMYTVIVVPSAQQTLISGLGVNNSSAVGGTGLAYEVCPGGAECGTTTSGFVNGALQYRDRTFHFNSAPPTSLNGQSFIMTANTDKAANPGATDFVHFTLGQAATVYIAYCTTITTKPSWLTSNFTSTGATITNDNGFTFALYSRSYVSGSQVVLGSNVPAGQTTNQAMYTIIVVPTGSTSLINSVNVTGGTPAYGVCGTGGTCGSTTGFVNGALQYTDRSTITLAGTVPANVNGRTFIQTAQADSGKGATYSLSFALGQSAAVYVAHDVRIPLPTWLQSQFLDTGVSVNNNNGTPGSTFEIYSNLYPSGTTVQLGSNTQSGTTIGDMYSVIVAQTTTNATAPNAPGSLALISGCNTAAVVGFTWTASTVNTGGLSIAGYRVTRNGTIIATVPFTQTSYQDKSVLQSTAYTYTVTAFDQAGNTSTASTLAATTPAKGASGDAPYCHSTVITGMTFDFLDAKSETNGNGSTSATTGAFPDNFNTWDVPPYTDGSDLWEPTWAGDSTSNATYIFFGDGWGLCGREDTSATTMGPDQTSFGIGKMTGYPSTGHCPPEWSNTYGGANSSKPNGGFTGQNLTSNNGLLLGKSSSIVAIGNDFYAFGAAWRAGDSSNYINVADGAHPPKGGPENHLEVISSTGSGNNAAAWVDGTTDLCNGTGSATAPVWGGALSVCPAKVVQFGPGYSGVPTALAGYVYIYGALPQNYLGSDPVNPGTFLVRVPTTQVATPSAYQYFAGLDSSGSPIWSNNGNQKQPIFKDLIDTKYTGTLAYKSADGTACAGQSVNMEMVLGTAFYDAPLHRFIAGAQGRAGQVAFYEAPNPWGPWSTIYYINLNMSNIYNSGWGMPAPGGLGGGFCTGSPASYARASGLGVHVINQFTDTTGKILVMSFSSNGLAPPSASDLGGQMGSSTANKNGQGNEADSLNMVHVTLTTSP